MVELGMGRDKRTLVFYLTIVHCTYLLCLDISPSTNSKPMDKKVSKSLSFLMSVLEEFQIFSNTNQYVHNVLGTDGYNRLVLGGRDHSLSYFLGGYKILQRILK